MRQQRVPRLDLVLREFPRDRLSLRVIRHAFRLNQFREERYAAFRPKRPPPHERGVVPPAFASFELDLARAQPREELGDAATVLEGVGVDLHRRLRRESLHVAPTHVRHRGQRVHRVRQRGRHLLPRFCGSGRHVLLQVVDPQLSVPQTRRDKFVPNLNRVVRRQLHERRVVVVHARAFGERRVARRDGVAELPHRGRDARAGDVGETRSLPGPSGDDPLVPLAPLPRQVRDAWEDAMDAVPRVGAVVPLGEGADLRGALAEVRALERRVVGGAQDGLREDLGRGGGVADALLGERGEERLLGGGEDAVFGLASGVARVAGAPQGGRPAPRKVRHGVLWETLSPRSINLTRSRTFPLEPPARGAPIDAPASRGAGVDAPFL